MRALPGRPSLMPRAPMNCWRRPHRSPSLKALTTCGFAFDRLTIPTESGPLAGAESQIMCWFGFVCVADPRLRNDMSGLKSMANPGVSERSETCGAKRFCADHRPVCDDGVKPVCRQFRVRDVVANPAHSSTER